MNVLALETSGLYGAVACFVNDALLFEIEMPKTERSARTLVPTIRRALMDASWSAEQIDLVAVTVGPGSFTGLRIGVTAAKSLAYATDTNVVGVSTLDVIARQGFAADFDGLLNDEPLNDEPLN